MTYPAIRRSEKLREKMDRFGIDHLSASAINCYINDPARWVYDYVLGGKTKGNPAIWRGKSVESVLQLVAISEDMKTDHEKLAIDRAGDLAAETFDQYVKLFMSENPDSILDSDEVAAEREFADIATRSAFPFFYEIDPGNFQSQKRVEIDLGIEVPCIGYADFIFGGRVWDLKTTKQFPSEYSTVKNSVKRQVALYAHALSLPVSLLYAGKPTKDQKSKTAHNGFKQFDIPGEEIENLVDEFRMAARAMRRLLMNADSYDDLVEMVFPNFDSFYWDEEDKIAARKIWSFRDAA